MTQKESEMAWALNLYHYFTRGLENELAGAGLREHAYACSAIEPLGLDVIRLPEPSWRAEQLKRYNWFFNLCPDDSFGKSVFDYTKLKRGW